MDSHSRINFEAINFHIPGDDATKDTPSEGSEEEKERQNKERIFFLVDIKAHLEGLRHVADVVATQDNIDAKIESAEVGMSREKKREIFKEFQRQKFEGIVIAMQRFGWTNEELSRLIEGVSPRVQQPPELSPESTH